MRKTGGYIAGGVGSLMHSLHPLFNHQMARYYLGPPLLFFQPPSLHYLGVHHFPHASPLGDWLLQLFTNNHGRIIWSHSFCHGWKTKWLIAWKLSCFYACHLVPLNIFVLLILEYLFVACFSLRRIGLKRPSSKGEVSKGDKSSNGGAAWENSSPVDSLNCEICFLYWGLWRCQSKQKRHWHFSRGLKTQSCHGHSNSDSLQT